jgi:CSLREA domain-containing protein
MHRQSHVLRVIAAGLALVAADFAHAATYVVNTTDVDLPDTNTGLAACDANPVLVGDQCTLRAAIMQANAGPGADTIVLPLDTTITLTLNGIGGAESGDLDITAPVTITGASFGFPANFADLPRILANFPERVFDIGQDVAVTLRGMQLTDGNPTGGAGTNGGALRITASGANVLVDRVRFAENIAATGAAISNSGTLVVEGSDFFANIATTAASAIQTNASGNTTLRGASIREIRNDGVTREALRVSQGGILVVENSYIDGASQLGAPIPTPTTGIRADRPALLAVRNSTLVDFTNYAIDFVADGATQVRVYNTILSGSGIADCALSAVAGPPADIVFDYNIVQTSACGEAVGGGNRFGISPLLGAIELGPNRFFTTRRPVFGSVAIDGGAPADAPGTDPLRLCTSADIYATPRPLDGNADGTPRCDMGAVETSTLTSSTYVVNVFDVDTPDGNPGDDICDGDPLANGAQCNLRAAIMEANAKPGPDRIEFATGLGTSTVILSRAGAGGADVGDLDVTEQLVIEGVGSTPPIHQIDTNIADRILDVSLPAGQTFTLRNLRLRDGATTDVGGALRSVAVLTEVDNTIFAANSATNGGGAIAALSGFLSIRDSDFTSNTAGERGAAVLGMGSSTQIEDSSFRSHDSGDAFDGATIYLEAGDSAQLRRLTLFGNDGGITTQDVDSVDVGQSTITGNGTFGLRIRDSADPDTTTARVRATIIAGHPSNNCQFVGSFSNNVMSYNLLDVANAGCAPLGSGSIIGAPLLAPIPYRPAGQTHFAQLPLTGSPVIDAIPGDAGAALCGGFDTRGITRPIDSDGDGAAECEIGAVELTATEADPREFVVNQVDDATDHAPGDGVCRISIGSQFCSLRAAVMEANALPGADRVVLPASAAPYTLTIPNGVDPDPASHGDLDVTDQLRITGVVGAAGNRPTIAASHGTRHFLIDTVAAPVFIEGLRLTGGTNFGSGGAIRAENSSAVSLRQLALENNQANGGGGAIQAIGTTMLIEDTDIAGNSTSGEGAAIRADASFLEIRRSSIRGSTDAGALGDREAIRAAGDGSTLIANSTISGNDGIGVRVVDGDLDLRNVTLTGNTLQGVEFTRLDGRNLLIRNTALTGNTLGACILLGAGNAGIATDGHNLTQGTGCNLQTGTTNIVQAASVLGPLVASTAEFTAYHVPLAGSILRDSGHPDINALGCLANDQRGALRPVDGDGNGIARCDIGAIEAATATNELFRNGFE